MPSARTQIVQQAGDGRVGFLRQQPQTWEGPQILHGPELAQKTPGVEAGQDWEWRNTVLTSP